MEHTIDTDAVHSCASTLNSLCPVSEGTAIDLSGVSPVVAATAEEFALWYRSTWLALDSAIAASAEGAHLAADAWEVTEAAVIGVFSTGGEP